MLVKIISKLVLVGFMLFMTASVAFAALTVSAAKEQGLIGEQADGLIGIVGSPTDELTALVEKTNSGRLAIYKQTAEKNGTSLEQAQAVAGQTLIGKAAPGEYIQNASGSWQKK